LWNEIIVVDKMELLGLVIIYFLSFSTVVNSDIAFEDELNDEEISEFVLEKYVAGSTDDLGRLFDLEKQLFSILDEFMIKNAKSDLNEEVFKLQEFFMKNNIDGALLRSQVSFN
jgi:hypothetical protein